MEAEEETADPGSAKKQPLNVHETKQFFLFWNCSRLGGVSRNRTLRENCSRT